MKLTDICEDGKVVVDMSIEKIYNDLRKYMDARKEIYIISLVMLQWKSV